MKDRLIEDVLKAKKIYIAHRQNLESDDYTVDRNFFYRNPDRLALSILEILPTYNGENAEQIFKRKLNKGNLVILDLGCGRGTAARDIEQRYPGKIKVKGLTAYIYEPLQIPNDQVKEGDIADIKKLFLPNSFDVIYSAATLIHVKRHFMDIIRQAYDLLKLDGVGLFSIKLGSDKFNKIAGLNELKNWLVINGYNFEFEAFQEENNDVYMVETISFKKSKEDLKLPLRHAGENGYIFDFEKAKKLN